MHIVVLDGYTLNPGDNPWSPLEQLAGDGSFVVHDRTSTEDILARSMDADILITNKVPLRAATLQALPRLRCIGVLATGYDVVDIQEARKRAIPVINVVNYGTESVAQHAMAMLLELCRHTALHDRGIRDGRWSAGPDWCFWDTPQVELTGKVMGILGYGTIGRRVAQLAHAFGMTVIAASARKSAGELRAEQVRCREDSALVAAFEPEGAPQYDPGVSELADAFRPAHERAAVLALPAAPVTFVDCDELFRLADVLSLHCPLSDQTRGIVNASRLAVMKDGAMLLNLARGSLLNESDVAAALVSGKLGGLAADVLSQEPAQPSNPLLFSPNTLLTPHIAWATRNARRNITRIMAENLAAWIAGAPKSVVN